MNISIIDVRANLQSKKKSFILPQTKLLRGLDIKTLKYSYVGRICDKHGESFWLKSLIWFCRCRGPIRLRFTAQIVTYVICLGSLFNWNRKWCGVGNLACLIVLVLKKFRNNIYRPIDIFINKTVVWTQISDNHYRYWMDHPEIYWWYDAILSNNTAFIKVTSVLGAADKKRHLLFYKLSYELLWSMRSVVFWVVLTQCGSNRSLPIFS
jgi:hypothetical protein